MGNFKKIYSGYVQRGSEHVHIVAFGRSDLVNKLILAVPDEVLDQASIPLDGSPIYVEYSEGSWASAVAMSEQDIAIIQEKSVILRSYDKKGSDILDRSNAALANQMTGVYPSGKELKFFKEDAEVSYEGAKKILVEGFEVFCPDAGAGSYIEVFKECLGYAKIRPYDQTSSSGSWTFIVTDKDGIEYLAFQEMVGFNGGYTYSVDKVSFDEDCLDED